MKIVVAYDGSDHAKAAVDELRRSGLPRQGKALVISVGETTLPPPSPVAPVVDVELSRRVNSTLVQARAQASQVMEEARVRADEGR